MNVVEFVVDGRLSGERTHRDVVEFVAVEVRSDAHPVVIGAQGENPDREVVAVTGLFVLIEDHLLAGERGRRVDLGGVRSSPMAATRQLSG